MEIVAAHKALEMAEEEKPMPMPDDFMKNVRESVKRKEIAARVHKENMHLYSQMSVADADNIIDMLIKDELNNNGLN
jgi:hypothetical protein